MGIRRLRPLIAVAALLAVGACKNSKSSNPLSPSIAGPIPGVEITAPKPLEPGVGTSLEAGRQPLTLLVENASSSGVRPLTYQFEVALDSGFTNKVYSRGEVAPGGGGRTSLNLPEPLASDRTYYWRARAEDGANTGPFSAGAHFTIFTPVVLQAPQLVSPIGDAQLNGTTPVFRLVNAARSGPVVSIVYEIQIATDGAFGQVVATVEQSEQVGGTQKAYDGQLAYSTRYFWRARAWEMSKNQPGPWSAAATFNTPVAPVVTPPPPTGGGAPGGYSTGPEVVAYVARTYPERLVPTASLSERDANMAFLRDRIIETGICGGIDLGWNLKRGVGPRSIDALAWRHDGIVEVVDVGAAYDGYTDPLRLQWILVGGTPGFDPYSPRPACK